MRTINEDLERIPYVKSPISIREQVKRLKLRGLIIDDEDLTKNYLSNISYYRLRAYTYPFQNNADPEKQHEFIRKDIHFKDIIELYRFDRRLRILVFNALENGCQGDRSMTSLVQFGIRNDEVGCVGDAEEELRGKKYIKTSIYLVICNF
ncbi:MAG: Abi family protein [Prevotella sp.]|nr:Abi family protein [Prevotella sp.]